MVRTEDGIVVYVDNQPVSVSMNHPSIGGIKKAINEGDGDKVLSLVNTKYDFNNAVKQYRQDVEFVDGVVYYKGEALNNNLTQRIISLHQEGFDVQSYLNFLDKLMQNPSYNSREMLFKFIDDHKLPITPEGDILGYKGVTSDFKDCHTRSFDNSVGVVNSMPRAQVDDNPKNDCSRGFHVGSESYATGFGDRTVIVKVNPKNAVSVPDYDTNKLRVCEYEVVAEYEGTLNRHSNNYDVDVDDLLTGDEIKFNYSGERRHIIVTDYDDDYITGELENEDVSYSIYSSYYRTFKKSDISNLELVSSDNDDEW